MTPARALGILEGQPQLRDFSLEKSDKKEEIDIEMMSQEQLLSLRAQIDAKITGISLEDVNLVRETLIQFQRAKLLQEDANKKESGVPMNQRAQVQNSLANILASLAKTQSELHSSESVKRLKAAVVKVVKELPTPQQERFFELLEGEFLSAQASMEA